MKNRDTKQGMNEEIEVPEGIETKLEGNKLTIIKEGKKVDREILDINIKIDKKKIILTTSRSTKRERKLIMTYVAHIKNMIKGIQEPFVYELKICTVHFPMNVSVDKNKNILSIKNFLGERKAREAKILDGVEVKVKGEIITVESENKEKAGQTAANFETVTKVRSRDRRIFQDGIFITKKSGKEI